MCRGGLVFEAHRLFVSLNSRLDSDKEEEEDVPERRGRLVPVLLLLYYSQA